MTFCQARTEVELWSALAAGRRARDARRRASARIERDSVRVSARGHRRRILRRRHGAAGRADEPGAAPGGGPHPGRRAPGAPRVASRRAAERGTAVDGADRRPGAREHLHRLARHRSREGAPRQHRGAADSAGRPGGEPGAAARRRTLRRSRRASRSRTSRSTTWTSCPRTIRLLLHGVGGTRPGGAGLPVLPAVRAGLLQCADRARASPTRTPSAPRSTRCIAPIADQRLATSTRQS